MTSRLLFSHFD